MSNSFIPEFEDFIAKTIPPFRRVERAYGVKIRGMLGMGSYGAVYATNDDARVVKFSIDPCEGPIWSRFMDVGIDRLPGIVTCHAVHQYRDEYQGKPIVVWTILRESIEPLSSFRSAKTEDPLFPGDDGNESVRMEFWNGVGLVDMVSSKARWAVYGMKRSSNPDLGTLLIGIEAMKENLFTADLAELYTRALDDGILIGDAAFWNIGYRIRYEPLHGKSPGKAFVLFDPGVSFLRHRMAEIPDLPTVKGKGRGVGMAAMYFDAIPHI